MPTSWHHYAALRRAFGLPIAQGIYLGKVTYISRDAALMEVGFGRSNILVSECDVDRSTLFEGYIGKKFEEEYAKPRTWTNVSTEILQLAEKYWSP